MNVFLPSDLFTAIKLYHLSPAGGKSCDELRLSPSHALRLEAKKISAELLNLISTNF